MAVEKELLKCIELLREGKEEGFNILYSHTYNYVYGRAKVIMKNEDDALDLTQETFIQAYKGIQQLEDVNTIYGWLGSITYRQGMKMYRKRREILVGEDAEGIFEDIEEDDSDYHPEVSAEEKATSEIMKSMIEELPELQKATIMAYYYDNMKIDSIAEVFECSSNTVKSRLNYAKKFLRTKVEEHEKENRYKLHSLTPAVFVFAFRSLVSGDKYVMSVAMAQGVYDGVCTGTGLAMSAIAVGEAGVFVAEGTAIASEASAAAEGAVVASESSVVSEGTVVVSETVAGAEAVGTSVTSTSAATGIGGTIVTETAVKTGMSIGMKILIGAAVVLTAGAVAVGAMSLGNDVQNTDGNQTVTQEDEQNGQMDLDNDAQEGKVRKYLTHYESSTISGTMVSVDRQYKFDENGFITKVVETYSSGDSVEMEVKWEDTEDGYITRSYYPGGILQGVAYYDKNLNSRRSESYNIETGNLQSEYEYNENGDTIKQVTYYPDGSVNTKVEYEYDDANHTVKEMQDDVVLQEWVYDENETLRSHYIRNLSYEIFHTYDEDGYILEQTNKKNGEVLNSLKYTYTSVEELQSME